MSHIVKLKYPAGIVRGTLCILVFAFSFLFFESIDHIFTDTLNHNLMAQKAWSGESAPTPNFLYFLILGFVGTTFHEVMSFETASSLLLAAAVSAKAFFTWAILARLAPDTSVKTLAFSTVSLLIIFPIPIALIMRATLHYYLGNLPMNVWHNSTTIFLMPVAVATFGLQAAALEKAKNTYLPHIVALVALGILIKPSFFFAYAPAMVTFLLFDQRMRQSAKLIALIPVAIGALMVAFQYILIFSFQVGNTWEGAAGIAISPFEAWSRTLRATFIPLAAFASLVFPLTYAICGLKPDRPAWFVFAIALFLWALVVYVMFIETGPRAGHGNLFWQVIVANYILHVVVLADLLGKAQNSLNKSKKMMLSAAYGTIATCGAVYLYRLLFNSEKYLLKVDGGYLPY